MKKLLFLILPFSVLTGLTSCNEDRLEGDEIISVDAVKIDSVNIPQATMDVYSTQTIKTYSDYTENCEGFYAYDYKHTNSLERNVVSYKFKTAANCGNPVTKVSQINFSPKETGKYIFKFFAGKNAAGEDTYITENIEVE